MKQDQDVIFAESEGNAWYRRNAAKLGGIDGPDALLDMAKLLPDARRAQIRSICDIGCANGERLARFAQLLPSAERLCGFDASSDAVAAGVDRFDGLDLKSGLADTPPFEGAFDLVTISFVLHWIDRTRLVRTLAAIDGLVADNGLLILSDFLPDRPCSRRYHHRSDVELFTYKQDYAAAFTGLGIYRQIGFHAFPHDGGAPQLDPSSDQDRAMCAMFVKSTQYPLAGE